MRLKHGAKKVAGTLALVLFLPSVAGASEPDTDLEELYHRARCARLGDRIEESFALFLQLSEQAAEQDDPHYRYRAEWWLGRIVKRWGDLEGALEHFQRALDDLATARARQLAGPLVLQRDEIGLLQNVRDIYEQQRKMGLVFNTEVRITALCDVFVEKVRTDALARSCATCNAKTMWSCMRERAGLLSRAAAYEQYERALRQVAEEAETRRAHYVVGRSLGSVASHLAHFERLQEALTVSRKCEAVPVDTQYGFEFFLRTIDHAARLAQRDGVTGEVWALVDRSLRNLESPLHYGALMSGRLIRCSLLRQAGRSEEAAVDLDTILGELQKDEYANQRAYALRIRAGCRMDMDQLDAAEEDLKASLSLYRELGRRRFEPPLYEMYAKLLTRQGRYGEALQTWRAAFELCESLKLHFRSLHMLLGPARLHHAEGNLEALSALWDRIDTFLSLHPDLPEPTTLRTHLARLDYLKWAGRSDDLVQAYHSTSEFVAASSLSEYQQRSFKAYRLDEDLPSSASPPAPLPTVDLQPVLMRTRVEAGELARGRFTLTNVSSLPATGTLEAGGELSPLVWESTESGWKASRAAAAGEDARSVRMTIPPGEERVLYLETAVNAGESGQVELRWQDEETATWEFEAGEESRTVSVVNASLAEDSPFYSVPFYHEVYYRAGGPALCNVRVEASEACRLEIADADTRLLLAVDANGDGDFEDEGDALYVDEDLDLYPELHLDDGGDVAAIEILVYPGTTDSRGERDIEVAVSIKEAGSWSLQAVNTLVLRGATGP